MKALLCTARVLLCTARVIGAASTDEKTALCRDCGADETINYTTENLKMRLKQLTANRGVDVVVDSVGGELSEVTLRGLGWHGRFLVLGFATGAIPKIPLNLALLNEREILGVLWGEAVNRNPVHHKENMTLLQTWLSAGHIAPAIGDIVTLEDAAAAIARLANRQAKSLASECLRFWQPCPGGSC